MNPSKVVDPDWCGMVKVQMRSGNSTLQGMIVLMARQTWGRRCDYSACGFNIHCTCVGILYFVFATAGTGKKRTKSYKRHELARVTGNSIDQ